MNFEGRRYKENKGLNQFNKVAQPMTSKPSHDLQMSFRLNGYKQMYYF